MKYKSLYKIAVVIISITLPGKILFTQTIPFTGTVRSGSEVLPSATVAIANQTNLTDKNGQFFFSISPGTYSLAITHTGYKKIEATINIIIGANNRIDFTMVANDLLDEVTIMGSKTGTERSSLNTAVPVDVVSSTRLAQTGQPSLIQMLFYSLPSLNADRQKIFEPITYRGMDPHHLLILLNNVRYHNGAYLNNGVPKSDLGRGSTTNDISTIPFVAVEKIEVLRDGASAHYGSDAIAGVLNIRLKESTGKTMIHANTGQYYRGDGFKSWIGLYKGVALTNKKISGQNQGFFSFSGEVRTQAPTTRAGIYDSLVYEVYRRGTRADTARTKAKDDSTILANGIDRRMFTKNSGTVKLRSVGILFNGAYPINNRLKTFWTGTINNKKINYWANYRYPNDSVRVNKLLHPHGFRPLGTNTNWDVTAIAGIKGIAAKNWSWELSSSYGSNSTRGEVDNTNNASQFDMLGKSAPTSFYLGTFVYNIVANSLVFTKDLLKNNYWRSSKLILGADWRLENYKMKAGDKAAYMDYDGSEFRQGGAIPSIGSVSDSDAVNKKRSASSVYADWEIEPNERLLIDAAARYEYYSDFGSNVAGKLAIRYSLNPKFLMRGSLSNGYRAPSLQQRYFSGIQSFRGRTEVNRVFNNESPVTKAFHIPSLTAEKATNLSLGFTSRLSSSISLTLDGYLIGIKDRIVLSGIFRKADPQVAAILIDYTSIDHVQFYTNAINTKTYGLDAVLNGNWNFYKTTLNVTLAGNVNRHSINRKVKTPDVITNISNYANTLFGIEERTSLRSDQPGEKIILSTTIKKGRYSFAFRNTYFGTTALATIINNGADTVFQTFSPRVLTDISISYNPQTWLTITLGANNICNIYPDRLLPLDKVSLYSNAATSYGTNGGYYSLGINLNL